MMEKYDRKGLLEQARQCLTIMNAESENKIQEKLEIFSRSILTPEELNAYSYCGYNNPLSNMADYSCRLRCFVSNAFGVYFIQTHDGGFIVGRRQRIIVANWVFNLLTKRLKYERQRYATEKNKNESFASLSRNEKTQIFDCFCADWVSKLELAINVETIGMSEDLNLFLKHHFPGHLENLRKVSL